jgi:DNA-binding CsgD family transcriptional regulator/methylmalonyl-CoA mutase cobalamin-binding subunit
MSSTATVTAPIDVPATTGRVLVCATGAAPDDPLVVLADGSYETAEERIFWRSRPECEVLRLPLTVPVATRPVRHFPPAPRSGAREGALIAAVRASRDHQQPVGDLSSITPDDLDVQLVQALETGDTSTAHALACLIWKRSDLASAYRTMSGCLAQLASSWAAGTGSVLSEHLATRTVAEVAERLRAVTPPATRCGTVVLAVPPGEQHTLGLTALAHLLQDAGRPVLVVDSLPTEELAELAGEPGTVAVVLSAHTLLDVPLARRLLGALRQAAPEVLLVLGGPGLPHNATSLGADLVTDDVSELLHVLDERSSALTGRERQVLLAVADGKTNGEIAELLGVAPATVKSHLDNILNKTSTEHRAAAVARALRRGWIQ